MQYGLGHLSVVPIRCTADPSSEMVSQLLYGDHFKIKEERKYYSKVQLQFDGFEGWINKEQYTKISKEQFLTLSETETPVYNIDFLSYASKGENELLPIVLGSRLDIAPILGHTLEEFVKAEAPSKSNLVETSLLYLNSPFLLGGKTPFGTDAPGLTQMVYRTNGHVLRRTVEEQCMQGEALSFIEESEPGDLAFFDDSEGIINHVGIILKDNYIIHASGHVRIDRLDHTGIFNTEKRRYTHSLRVIKRIV